MNLIDLFNGGNTLKQIPFITENDTIGMEIGKSGMTALLAEVGNMLLRGVTMGRDLCLSGKFGIDTVTTRED